ncbi:PAS domain S-box-containing protein [Agrobacterium larrymoorei]|uniref:histidine kinase n=1 Tax=Agrobacterium larrymoorei TaxID=160699 RepID=A0AAJ2BBM8_9HYPH|nr:ATP-binding protein [Agrobacterium larrymoorei]MDR6100968.1 PAS domain S-box-containing protein [Agrobacterium larrymoorei]
MLRVNGLFEPQELKHCIRDLVALSTLPTSWKDYNSQQIAESVAAALISMLNADIIYVSSPGLGDDAPVEVIRTSFVSSAEAIDRIKTIVRGAWLDKRKQAFGIGNTFGNGELHFASAPIGFGENAGIVAGSLHPHFPSDAHRLLLEIAASHATLAIERGYADAQQLRMASLVERSSELVGFVRLEGSVDYLNKAGCELLGLSGPQEARHLNIIDFITPDQQSRARRKLLPQVMETGRWLGELNFRHFKTGEDIPFLVDWFRIDDLLTGRPTNMATVSRDLRGQKKVDKNLQRLNVLLEQRVSERNSELAEALKRLTFEAAEHALADVRAQELQLELLHASRLSAVGQMAGALAHELNQPLTALTNLVNAGRHMISKNTHTVESVQEVLHEASAQALRAGEIVRRLREFVKRGETEMRIEKLPDLIREASALASMGSGTHGVRTKLKFDPRADAVLGNRVQLQQVMLNLIRNAHEAMVESERRELVVSTSRLDEETIEISVADCGPGVPDEIAEHLFEPFHTTKPDGMGLGLSICRIIVEAHGGTLQYEPNLGGGAIFRINFTFPREQ